MFYHRNQPYLIQYSDVEFSNDHKVTEPVIRKSTLCIKLLSENSEDPMMSEFCIAEAVCSAGDNFEKRVGRDIALGRMDSYLEGKYATDKVSTFTLSDALEGDVFAHSPLGEDGKATLLSSVVSPFAEVSLEWGLVLRLPHLIKGEVGHLDVPKSA